MVCRQKQVRVKQTLGLPLGLQHVGAPRFQDNLQIKVVGLSALCTVRLYPLGNIPGTHLFYSLIRRHFHRTAKRFTSMKISNDIIRNGTRDFPASSAVRQPTAPPHSVYYDSITVIKAPKIAHNCV